MFQDKKETTSVQVWGSFLEFNSHHRMLPRVSYFILSDHLHIEIYSGCVTHETGIVYYEAVWS